MTKETRLPEIGDIVRYRTKHARRGILREETRIGTVTVIWAHSSEDGPYIDTTSGTFIPALGDTWEMLC